MKKVLGLLLISSSVFSMQLSRVKPEKLPVKLSQYINFNTDNEKKVQINPSLVRASHKLGDIELYYGKKGFTVWQDDKKQVIQKCFTDQMMRNITKEQLHAFLQAGYLSINQMNEGTFSLQAKGRVVGGGVIGATIGAFLGKAAVSVAGHGTIILIATLTGPAFPVTIIALESCFGAAIETTSLAGAVAGGIALGVATGPV